METVKGIYEFSFPTVFMLFINIALLGGIIYWVHKAYKKFITSKN